MEVNGQPWFPRNDLHLFPDRSGPVTITKEGHTVSSLLLPELTLRKLEKHTHTHTHTHDNRNWPPATAEINEWICNSKNPTCLQGVDRDNYICSMFTYAHMSQSLLARQQTYWLRQTHEVAANCSSEDLTYLKQRKRPLIKHPCVPHI
jgi:hypothetical protein